MTVVAALLDAERLPLAGLKDHFDQMLVARDGSRIVGCAALELYRGWRAAALGGRRCTRTAAPDLGAS